MSVSIEQYAACLEAGNRGEGTEMLWAYLKVRYNNVNGGILFIYLYE